MAQIRYFLGANSPNGFYSLYDQLIDLESAQAVYLLKGGPGCGKSSFMRRVARHAEAAGYSVQYILCSGDPDSLDAIVIPDLSIALVDATARGFDVVACPCPLAPDRLEHLLIPGLGLAFVTSSQELAYPGRPYRRLHLDTLACGDVYRRYRARVRFTRKVSAALKAEAVQALARAKAQHDALEAHYNPFVDFDGVYAQADQLANQIIPETALTASPPSRPEGSPA